MKLWRGFIAAAGVLALAGSTTALRPSDTEIEVRLADSAGRVVGAWTVTLHPGEQRRLHVDAGDGPVADAIIDVRLADNTADGAQVHVSARATDQVGEIVWASHALSVERGVWNIVALPGDDLVVGVGLDAGPFRLDAPGEPVKLTTTVLVRELTSEGPRTLSRHRVRLRGPRRVELNLSPAGSDGVALRIFLAPRSRNDEGARLDLSLETPGVAGAVAVRDQPLSLRWDDEVRIAGLQGARGEIVVDIKPER